MSRSLCWSLVAVSVILTTQAPAADWPQFRGPSATGLAPDTGINKNWAQKPPKELWRTAMSDNGYAGPSVAQGMVSIVDHVGAQDVVRAINLQTGQDVWRYAYDNAARFDYGYCRSTPVFSEGRLYVWSREGLLLCLNATTGQLQWQRNLVQELGGKAPGWGLAGSVLIDGDRLIVCPGGAGGNTVCLDKRTGQGIWRGGTADVPGHATPVVADFNGSKQYVIATSVSVMGLDAATGKALWGIPWKNQCSVNAATPIVVPPYVFITTGYGFGCALLAVSPKGVSGLWQNKNMQAHFSSPIFYGNCFYGTTDPGDLICMNPRDGSVIWRRGGFEKGGIVIVDGVIIAVSGGNGDVVMVQATYEGYHELGRIRPLGGQSWTAPIIADGKLILRNTKTLVCLDLM